MTDITFLTNPYTSRFPSTRGWREIVRDLRRGAGDVEIPPARCETDEYRGELLADVADRACTSRTGLANTIADVIEHCLARAHDASTDEGLRSCQNNVPLRVFDDIEAFLAHARRRHVTLAHDRPKERTRSIDAEQRQPGSLLQERLKITSIADDAFETAQRISENAAMGHDWSRNGPTRD